MARKEFNLEETVHRLLTPQETLAPWIFDENQKILPDVRDGLLKIAQKIIDKTIKPINGLDVVDICLQGSSGDYFYYDKSDFDLFIEVHNNGCNDIINNQKDLDLFLYTQMYSIQQKYRFHYQKRFIDPKIGSKLIQFIGKYSILNSTWRIKPNKDLVKNLSEKEMIIYYEKKRYEILAKRQKLIEKYAGIKLAKALNELYLQIIDHNPNIKDYYVYKLLNYENLLKPLGAECIQAYNRISRL